MRTLYEYIIESETKFDKYVEEFHELLEKNKSLNAHKYIDLLNNFFIDLIELSNYKPKEMFIYADGAKHFKIPYAYNSSIITLINSKYSKDLQYTESGNKIKILSKHPKKSLFETGSGSIGRVSTEHQEQATCLVWNNYIDVLKQNKIFDFQDMDFIKNIVGDLTPDFDSEWISTFSKQIQCLVAYFESRGLNPRDYKLIRYGDKHDIGNAYKKFSDAYTKAMDNGLGSQKDNFDPADVIAYNVNKIGYINSKLMQYSSSPIISKEKYKEELFDTHMVVGISLKKISGNKSPQFDLYNTGHIKCDNVNSFEVLKNSNKTQLLILCKGKFNFDSTTENGDEIGSQNSVKLVMRSFGDGTTAVDCTLVNPIKKGSSPTLGKCPARFWREVIGSDKKTDLETNIQLFRSFIENENSHEVLTKLKDLIKAAVKEGPSCFPFVLIH